jgi:hypothetical protein
VRRSGTVYPSANAVAEAIVKSPDQGKSTAVGIPAKVNNHPEAGFLDRQWVFR